MTMRDHEREGGSPRDDVVVDRTSLLEDVSEAPRPMKSPSPEEAGGEGAAASRQRRARSRGGL